MQENGHFRLDWSTPQDIGRKAIAECRRHRRRWGRGPTFVVGFGHPLRRRRLKASRWSTECVGGGPGAHWCRHRRRRSGQLPAVGGVGLRLVTLTVVPGAALRGERPARCWPRRQSEAGPARLLAMRCGATGLKTSPNCAAAIWCRSRPTAATARRPRLSGAQAMIDVSRRAARRSAAHRRASACASTCPPRRRPLTAAADCSRNRSWAPTLAVGAKRE